MTAKEIFLQALRIESETERTAWIETACAGDEALQRRVLELLEAHAATGEFMDRPAVTETIVTAIEHAGTMIGQRYKLLEEIAEGGMGTVWMAEQTQPVRRRVAIKLIKPGMDSKQVLSRFEAERQALALMDHPHIAKVLDGGVTEQGRPYFVMEYVKGVPITQFCDQARLNVRERLKLMAQVCQAVQHAHQKGIIHRDLKPSNILVCLYDGQPVPKVIDFGLAKALHQPLTEGTVFTAHGMMVGTPLYMSPEQAEFNNLDIDTRSDVYSLGVILYELLTGSTPLDKQRFQNAAIQEIIRLIKEEEPSKPSTKLSGSVTLPSIAAQRSLEPTQLSKLIRGDLDWIVMKSLDKERSRRYETANALSKDIERYLTDLPIEACPPSAMYKFRKFARRNRLMLGAIGAVAATLVIGIVGTSFGMLQADRMRRVAERSAQAERRARELESAERLRAERARDRTVAVLDAMTSDITGDSLIAQTQVSEDQKRFLREVLSYYREFASEQSDDPDERDRAANNALRVGQIEIGLGNREQAIIAFQRAIDEYTKLVADFPHDGNYRERLGLAHLALGLFAKELGDLEQGTEHLQQSVRILSELVAEFPEEPQPRSTLATVYMVLGTAPTGSQELTSEMALLNCLELNDSLARDFPDAPQYRWQLAESHRLVSDAQMSAGNMKDAMQHSRDGLAIAEALAAEFPANPDYLQVLALCHGELGWLLSPTIADQNEAREHLDMAIELLERLRTQFPSNPEYSSSLVSAFNQFCNLLRLQGNYSESMAPYRRGIAVAERLTLDYPTVRDYRVKLGTIYLNYADLFHLANQPQESFGWYNKAIDLLTPMVRASPDDVESRRLLMWGHLNRGKATLMSGEEPNASIDDFSRAVELASEAEKWHMRAMLVIAYFRADRVAEASATLTKAAEGVTFSGNTAQDNAEGMYNLACAYSLASGKIPEEEQRYGNQAMNWLQQALDTGRYDASMLAVDPDLAPLHNREDFQQLLEELSR